MESKFPPLLAYGPEKFVDRNPNIKAAGNLTHYGNSVADCLFISHRNPYGYVKRFLKPNIYPIGHSTQLPSRVNDPCYGSKLCNGISTYPSEPLVNLISPPEISKFEAISSEIAEKNKNPVRQRLSVGHAPLINLSPDDKPCEKRCGKVLKSDTNVYDVFHYPAELRRFCNCKHHRTKIDRHYNEHFNPNQTFGNDDRIHFNDGRIMKNVLYQNSLHENFFPVPFALEQYRQQNTTKLGESLEPNCDTGVALLSPGHTFGGRNRSNPIDEVFNPKADDDERTRELLKSIYNAISARSFNQFDKFLSICLHFDKSKSGKISVDNLKCACKDTNIPITTKQFVKLLEWCDLITPTKTVYYMKFYKIINANETFTPTDVQRFEKGMKEAVQRLDKATPSDETKISKQPIVRQLKNSGKSKFPRQETCPPIVFDENNGRKPIDPINKKIDDILTELNTYRSTLHEIDSDVTDTETKSFRTFGHPLVRSEHPPPKVQRIGDLTNYGEEADAYACLYPSIYTQVGVSKRDMLKPRSKDELYQIFQKVYKQLSTEQFNTLWQLASKQSCDCTVSLEAIRLLLKEFNMD